MSSVEAATTEDIFRRPLHPYTQQLMACVPRLGQADQTITAIPGIPPAVNNLPPGCAFADRCERAQAACREGDVQLRWFGEYRAARCIRIDEVES